MYINVYQPRIVTERRVYLPTERGMVHGRGLGEDKGLAGFNIGKMFKRMVTIKPKSFTFKNIMGAVGSVAANVMTFGAASAISGKTFGAHSKTMQQVGMGMTAAVAAAGAVVGGAALLGAGAGTAGAGATAGATAVSGAGLGVGTTAGTLGTTVATGAASSGGFLSVVGSGLASVGSGIATAVKGLSVATGLATAFGGKGGGGSGEVVMMGSGGESGVPMQYPTDPSYLSYPTAAQVTGYPQEYYPQIQQPALMYAGQAGVGTLPGSSAMYGGYYDGGGTGGAVDEGLIREGKVVMDGGQLVPSTIISGVADQHVYIAGAGIAALALWYALS